MADKQNKDHNPNGWVPCDESLPIDGEWVLVWGGTESGDDISLACWQGTGWHVLEPDDMNVTHWMPLPAGPDDETEDRNDAARLDWLDDNSEKLEQICEDIADGVTARGAIDRAIEGWEWPDDDE